MLGDGYAKYLEQFSSMVPAVSCLILPLGKQNRHLNKYDGM